MSGRPTADIEADLRRSRITFQNDEHPSMLEREAADRLADLDSQLTHWDEVFDACRFDGIYGYSKQARIYNEVFQLRTSVHVIDALRPPCPACGGTNTVHRERPKIGWMKCPDCIDGKVPIERLVRVFEAVYDDTRPCVGDAFDYRYYLRGIS